MTRDFKNTIHAAGEANETVLQQSGSTIEILDVAAVDIGESVFFCGIADKDELS